MYCIVTSDYYVVQSVSFLITKLELKSIHLSYKLEYNYQILPLSSMNLCI